MPNKTKKLQSLSIPEELFFDFLRGHLDGDGSITKYFDPVYPKSLRLYLSFLSASLNHLLWLKNTIGKLTSIHGYLSEGKRVYMLKYSKYNSIKLLNKIYHDQNVPCLKRKLSIAKEFISRRGDGTGRHARFRAVSHLMA